MQPSDLTGKTALITDASMSLGEQFAHALSGAVLGVLLTDHNWEANRGRQR